LEIARAAGGFMDLYSWAFNELLMLAKATTPASNRILIVIERSLLGSIA
jgi:hypothetical protein